MKNLDYLPPRILRFCLHLDRFSYDIKHVPGEDLYTADTLGTDLHKLADLIMMAVIVNLPASSQRLQTYRKAQSEDSECKQITTYCHTGRPDRKSLDPPLRHYWQFRGEITMGDGLLLRGQRIIVLQSLRVETLSKLHEGHQGIVRCRLRGKMSVWWPGLSQQLTQLVERCPDCAKKHRPNKEPLIMSSLPEYPWQAIAADLFHLKGTEYLVVVDYFSRFPEVIQLRSTTSQSVINSLKAIFARHGIPETLRPDNGPQFVSQEFTEFSSDYQFTHITSSPHFSSSNGQAERTVQPIKRLIKDADDPFAVLLSYRVTPLPWCSLSPAQLLMGRKLRSCLPQTIESLTPQWSYLQEFRDANEKFKDSQRRHYDHQHRVRSLPEIPDYTDVWVTTNDNNIPGRTVRMADTPRSYIVQTPTGELRRNWGQINVNPSTPETQPTRTETTEPRSAIRTRSRTGVTIVPPKRLT